MHCGSSQIVWPHLVAMLITVGFCGSGLAEEPACGDKRYRLIEIQAGPEGVWLSGGSAVFESGGVFSWKQSETTEIGGWSSSQGLLSTFNAESLGTGTRLVGVDLGSLLLGIHYPKTGMLRTGVALGFNEPRSPIARGLLSLVETTNSPPRTEWVPDAPRYGEPRHAAMPGNAQFYALHGGVRCADEVSVAYLPVFQPVWTAESHFFVPDGVSFDHQGHAYFTPFQPEEDAVLLVSVDGESGARRFAIASASRGQGGAPLILNDGAGQVAYAGGTERIVAVDTRTGALLWEQTDLAPLLSTGNGAEDEIRRMMGINYHAATDTLIAAYTHGFLVALSRDTGAILGSIDLPGAPAVPGQIDEEFLETYEAAINAELDNFDVRDFGADQFASVLLGGDVVIANYFSVDPHSARLWVGGTLPDEADGTVDGMSELGALYGIDVLRGDTVTFAMAAQVEFQGGSASTASIRADGARVYIADGESRVLAYDRQGQLVWMVDVGAQVFGSLAVSSFGAIYASTARGVTKIREVGSSAEIEWQASLNGIYKNIPAGWEVRNLNLVGIGANGVMVQTSLGPLSTSGGGLPVRMALTLLDRGTGLAINSSPAVEETVAAMSSGPDGAIVLANSPARRILLRALTADSPGQAILAPPLVGGLTKYGTVRRFDLLARDAAFAAVSVLRNAEQTFESGDQLGGESGIDDTRDLIGQCDAALLQSLRHLELTPATVVESRLRLKRALAKVEGADLHAAVAELQIVSDLLNAPPGSLIP